MTDDEIVYKQAVKDVKELVNDVLDECNSFASKYDYEKDWVYDRFREEFNKLKKVNTMRNYLFLKTKYL